MLVDTGSTDRTIEIAKQYGARVYCRPWDNNFSAARNLSLEIASKDWILVLDADEVLNPNVCREIKDLVNREAACYRINDTI
ncbi:MAG: glycosyltransferase [Bdellovibrionota bacterium]